MVINNKYHILVDSKNVLGSLKSNNGTSTFIEIEKKRTFETLPKTNKKMRSRFP